MDGTGGQKATGSSENCLTDGMDAARGGKVTAKNDAEPGQGGRELEMTRADAGIFRLYS